MNGGIASNSKRGSKGVTNFISGFAWFGFVTFTLRALAGGQRIDDRLVARYYLGYPYLGDINVFGGVENPIQG